MKSTGLHPSVTGFRLETVLQQLGTQHQLKVARRFADGKSKVVSKAEAARVIAQTLDESAHLDQLIARLHPTELALLGELRRRGGLVSGWALYVHARLHRLPPPDQSMNAHSAYLFGSLRPAGYDGAVYLWSLLADGLLFPVAVPNPWLWGQHWEPWRLFPGAPEHLVLADPRLLARLPEAPAAPPEAPAAPPEAPAAPPEAPAAPLAELPTAPPAPGAHWEGLALWRLQLLEVLRVLAAHGGLTLTKDGAPNRLALRRVLGDLAALPQPELALNTVLGLGLLRRGPDHSRLIPDPEARVRLGALPLASFADLTASAFPDLRLDSTGEGSDEDLGLGEPGLLQACVLELLRLLPGPVRERDLRALTERIIPSEMRSTPAPVRHLSPSMLRMVAAQPERFREVMEEFTPSVQRGAPERQWADWLSRLLRGPLSATGLVHVSEGEEDAATVTPNPLLRGADAAPDANDSGPAWVLQPNFELLVYPSRLTAERLPLLAAAQALRFDAQTASYRLTRESVYHGLEQGLDLEALLGGLGEASAMPMTPAMRRTLGDWAARRERLVLHRGATLMEYPSAAERDRALARGGAAVGDTFLLLPPERKPAAGVSTVRYDREPAKMLDFQPDGSFGVNGPLDLVMRGLLHGRVIPAAGGRLHIASPQQDQHPRELLAELEARSSGRLPEALRLQLGVWSGRTPAPVLAQLSVLQHPQARILAEHPGLKAHLGPPLSPTLLTVRAGQEAELKRALIALGLAPGTELAAGGESGDLVVLGDTRKKRAFLEEAIRSGHRLLVHYHEETEDYSGWNTRHKPGKLRQAVLQPQAIDRSGSTPYLQAEDVDSGEALRVRVAYITAMALR